MTRWIVSRRQDLLWFQGSALLGLGLVLLFRSLPPLGPGPNPIGHPAVLVLFLWGALFDATHVWGTYARSYLAPEAASREGVPGAWSWGLFAIGPLAAIADHALAPGRIFAAFLVGAYLWGYWHLVRQHYGLLVLYRVRSKEFDERGARIDHAILWVGCLYPYLRYTVSPAYASTGLPMIAPEAWAPAIRLALDLGAAIALAGLLALAVSGRGGPFRAGPKHVFLAVVLAYHWTCFAALRHPLAITAALNLFHNLQYHRIVWHYEKGRGRKPSGGLGPYLALGVLLGIAWYGPRIAGAAVLEASLARDVLLGACWGLAFHHYLVDGRIWRVRRTPSVAQALAPGAAT